MNPALFPLPAALELVLALRAAGARTSRRPTPTPETTA